MQLLRTELITRLDFKVQLYIKCLYWLVVEVTQSNI